MSTAEGLQLERLIGTDHELVLAEVDADPAALVQVQPSACVGWDLGSRGIPDRCCYGLIASAARHQPLVATAGRTSPVLIVACAVSSAVGHLVSGNPWSAGRLQASALTSATSAGVNTRGCSDRDSPRDRGVVEHRSGAANAAQHPHRPPTSWKSGHSGHRRRQQSRSQRGPRHDADSASHDD